MLNVQVKRRRGENVHHQMTKLISQAKTLAVGLHGFVDENYRVLILGQDCPAVHSLRPEIEGDQSYSIFLKQGSHVIYRPFCYLPFFAKYSCRLSREF